MCRLAVTILLAFGALHASADTRTFRDAEALIDGGDAEQAVSLLLPLQATYAGDGEFDYLLGLALLESGQPDAAIATLQSILDDAQVSAGLQQRAAQVIVALGGTPNIDVPAEG